MDDYILVDPILSEEELEELTAAVREELQKIEQEKERRRNFFHYLGLTTYNGDDLDGESTYNILNDKDKLGELITKLNNKAFW